MNGGRVRAYIDGFNLYHAIEKLNDPELKWINLRQVCATLLRSKEVLDEVHFFTAIWVYDGQKQLRHKNYIAAQKACGVEVHEGKFSKPERYCQAYNRHCSFREEKQTDVAIAVKMTADALSGHVDRMILVTADSDQIPTARLVASCGLGMTLAFPPGRSKEARHLGSYFRNIDRKELKPGRLKSCRLPREVLHDGIVVARMPAIYQVG